MKLVFFCAIGVGYAASICSAADAPSQSPATLKSRKFEFYYGAKVKSLPAESKVRVWFPVPQSHGPQKVKIQRQIAPGDIRVSVDPTYGNQIAYFETTAGKSGEIEFQSVYDVERSEVRALDNPSHSTLSDEHRDLFLAANSRVPVSGRPIALLNQLTFSANTVEVARKLYDRVDAHVRYDKSNPGYGNGDAMWVCDSRSGNCTDFHSLFISFARSKGIPSRFEIGFPLPPERGAGELGGYHCWGWFHSDEYGWVPVDISEADKHPDMKDYYFGNITENRIGFTTGRDIELVPKQSGPALNYFVYPHVEVDGKRLSRDKIELAFAYSDKES